MQKSQKIHIIEDDTELAGLIASKLEGEGYDVTVFNDGIKGCEGVLSAPPSLVILDIMLPGMDGFEVCRRVRRKYRGPILMLTARDDDLDQILGLEMGADDYVIKPIRPRVLVARIRALLRRGKSGKKSEPLMVGALTVNATRREAHVNEVKIDLTTIEYDLLFILAQNAGKVVSREELYQALYGTEYDGCDRSVDVYISRIRQKMGDVSDDPQYLKTVRGVGYMLAGEGA